MCEADAWSLLAIIIAGQMETVAYLITEGAGLETLRHLPGSYTW